MNADNFSRNQAGATAIGFLIMATIVLLFGFAGLKLTPIYLEHMKIVSVLNDVKIDLDGKNPSIQEIRAGIGRRLNIEMVSAIKSQDFKIRKTERGYEVRARYENRTPYVGNLHFLGDFNNAVEIER